MERRVPGGLGRAKHAGYNNTKRWGGGVEGWTFAIFNQIFTVNTSRDGR